MMPSTLRPKKKFQEERSEFDDQTQQMQYFPSTLRPKNKQEEIKFDNSKQEKSFLNDVLLKSAKEVGQGPAGQIALGLTQAATSPLDLVKLYLTSEGLQGLEEAREAHERMGIPFNPEEAQQKFLEAMEYFPTQQLAEEWLNNQGIDTKPKGRFEKFLRGLSEFAGLTNLQPKGINLPKLQSKALSAEGQSLRNTAEKFGLRKFAGMEAEKGPSITPIVSAEREAKLTSELGETSKKAIDDIISQKIPIKEMRDKGVNLTQAYNVAYDSARQTAKKMGNENIDLSNVLTWINQEIKKTKGSSPSLSDPKRAYINVLRKERDRLTETVTPKKQPTLFGPSGEILTKEVKPKRVQKAMTADQALNQYQDFNANVKGIWKKPEFAGSESAVTNAYSGLNEQFIKAIQKSNPQLASELEFANRLFHNTSKLNQTEKILGKSFANGYDPKKMHNILSGERNRKFLERNLGRESVVDLERIAKYGKEAQTKVLDKLKNPKTIKEYLSSMTPMQLGLLMAGKAHVGSVYYLPKATWQRVKGLLFTRNSTRKDYLRFLKDSSKFGSVPSSQAMIQSARNLQKSIEEEFGSEQALMEMASED